MLKLLGAVISAAALVACGGAGGDEGTSPFGDGSGTSPFGGGNGNGNGGGSGSGSPSIALTISSASPSASTPATVSATVSSASGVAAAGTTVAFSTAGTIGVLGATSAQTSASGVASVTLSPASSTSYGSDLVIAKTTVGSANIFGVVQFTIPPPSGAASTPSLALNLTSSNVSGTTPVTVKATLLDGSGQPVNNVAVSFRTVAGGIGTLSPTSQATIADGTATVMLTALGTGADLLIAQATVGGVLVTESTPFASTAP